MCINGLTTRHASPNLIKTFEVLGKYHKANGPNETTLGRGTKHSIRDMIDHGQGETDRTANTATAEQDIDEEELAEDDIIVEL